ncbi:hypothetical protein COEREDRAFT_81273 [Coemansia reversa NRRL 1564]|uniref:Uncharacterized protein n=1 Tax=Coemansia reversa (strain ATCC 12441 / NRRL 1564) TaxID=763665 RepID=A0A2G5BB97_COERN|nr:hypothetical protein COEREDRAFT_81273 [Coemansia reversa NRRL 1564]|eukprot:PIA16288.1 hypothetical protein COEREDRAFT_81273 [Coemansia reversa NRRL 1564]
MGRSAKAFKRPTRKEKALRNMTESGRSNVLPSTTHEKRPQNHTRTSNSGVSKSKSTRIRTRARAAGAAASAAVNKFPKNAQKKDYMDLFDR